MNCTDCNSSTSCKCKKYKICGCEDTISCKCWYYDGAALPNIGIADKDSGCKVLEKLDVVVATLIGNINEVLPTLPEVPMTESVPSTADGWVLFRHATTGVISWQPARLVTLTA